MNSTLTAPAPLDDYGPDSFQVLRDADHIRQRPGMYIGDTGTHGLHHLVYELVHNSVDEALGGHCHNIYVRINIDGSISVADDGRGIPVEEHPKEKRPTIEVALTSVGGGAKFDKKSYKTSAGLHGMGAKAVTALSDWTEARVRRNGRVYSQEYERGKAITGVKDLGASDGTTGTTITFHPDPEIFRDADFSFETLENRLRELAFLNKGLAITLFDERTTKEQLYKYEGGLAEFVAFINQAEDTLHQPPLHIDRTVDDVRVEVAMQYTKGDEERVKCYTNNAYNSIGGTHLSGFRSALTRTLKAYGDKENLFKNDLAPVGEDFREGLTLLISVQVPEPQFDSQEKKRLNNLEVEGIVSGVVGEYLGKFLEENPKDAKEIVKKVVTAAEAREAAAKARKALKDKKNILNGGGLPGKLMDCTKRGEESELFLVEGDSAGGSAENGRDRYFQAILPLRGKPLNVERAQLEKVLGNEEICSIISAVGIDIGENDDLSKCRYGKIVLLTDADVDGQHIRTLLLTFFYRQMPRLLAEGHVFVARPPLFKVTQRKQVRYVQTLEAMDDQLVSRGLEGSKLSLLKTSPPAVLEGERLGKLVEELNRVEGKLQILERRGLMLSTFLAQADAAKGLPSFKFTVGGKVLWFHTTAEVDAFREAEKVKLGRELVVTDGTARASANGNGVVCTLQELHEVKALNRGLEKLREFGLTAMDLVPVPRVAGREPESRFMLENGDSKKSLPQLRDLLAEIRRLGERGMAVVRFKGLGEMDGTELWDTTLDPKHRTLLQVKLEDAFAANELFKKLMGDEVEPRRRFIQEHALDVRNIDIHGA